MKTRKLQKFLFMIEMSELLKLKIDVEKKITLILLTFRGSKKCSYDKVV